MSADLAQALHDEFERRQRIGPLCDAIRNASDWRARLDAIRRYYAAVRGEIMATDPRRWALDPYEVDWPMLFTPIEAALWSDIRRLDVALYPQWPAETIERTFFCDFANPVAMVAIECDGAAFHDAVKDRERDRLLKREGWTVFRFTGAQCRQDMDPETLQRSDVAKALEKIARGYFFPHAGIE